MSQSPPIRCPNADGDMAKVYLTVPSVVIPPNMRATGGSLKYYGVTNAQTGAGITKNTDVSIPPGIKVKKVKTPKPRNPTT